MAEATEMVLPALREMRVDMATRFGRVDVQFDIVECRLNRVETPERKLGESERQP